MIHTLGGIPALFLPWATHSIPVVGILCAQYVVLLCAAKRFKMLQSIHGVERATYGAELYPVAVLLCFCMYRVFDDKLFHTLPLSIVVFADAAAAVCGRRCPIKTYRCFGEVKSVGGSTVFFVVAFGLAVSQLYFYSSGMNLKIAAEISFVCTIVENFGVYGIDNILVPVGAFVLLLF